MDGAPSNFHAPIAEQIWDMKYRLKRPDGTPVDETIKDTWLRVAHALSEPEAEKDQQEWFEKFYDALRDFKFIPAGRILAGAGTGRDVTLFNCFVMGTIPDSMEGIFSALKEAALTMQQGGGIGYDFSTIRPKGALVKGVSAEASGPLSFMDCWDAMCRSVMSAGSRRGAMMATLRCDHPDVLDFVEAKRDPSRLRMFNLSVLCTDDFMEAVEDGTDWDLVFGDKVYRTIPARELWDQIMRATYDVADPGVIFIDRINKANNLFNAETIAATNPCGEQPLPPYGACLLGSINLAALVRNRFDPKAGIDSEELRALVATAVRMLDNVVDVSRFPLEAQADEARAKRRIGLGVTGLADALAFCGERYGSERAVNLMQDWLAKIEIAAYTASAELAEEKGPYQLFDATSFLISENGVRLPASLRDKIRSTGLRNSHLTSIAPTGTISLVAGNVSSGIEPIFALSYTRKVLQPDGSRTEEVVEDYAVREWRRLRGDDPLPDYFVTAQDLTPGDHIAMQAAAQRYIDSSISKTINCPEDIPFEDFQQVYRDAYEGGCKGCTTYRPNAVTGSVLSVDAPKDSKPEPEKTEPGELLERPEVIEGKTYKLRWPESPHAIYVTVNDAITASGSHRPLEVFINSKNTEHYAWTVALTRMVSAVFRRGGDVSFVVEELKAVFDPRGGGWIKGRYVPSVLAAIGGVIERHMVDTGYLDGPESEELEDIGATLLTSPPPKPCPSCGSHHTRMDGGCLTCGDCGYSKCG
ncbi:MAG: adenosylcobalamin-dependent ribonucleoside-diphosphate reductase [Pseudomonadota bacterium]